MQMWKNFTGLGEREKKSEKLQWQLIGEKFHALNCEIG